MADSPPTAHQEGTDPIRDAVAAQSQKVSAIGASEETLTMSDLYREMRETNRLLQALIAQQTQATPTKPSSQRHVEHEEPQVSPPPPPVATDPGPKFFDPLRAKIRELTNEWAHAIFQRTDEIGIPLRDAFISQVEPLPGQPTEYAPYYPGSFEGRLVSVKTGSTPRTLVWKEPYAGDTSGLRELLKRPALSPEKAEETLGLLKERWPILRVAGNAVRDTRIVLARIKPEHLPSHSTLVPFFGLSYTNPRDDEILVANWAILWKSFSQSEKQLLERIHDKTEEVKSLRDGLFNATSVREASRSTTMNRYVIVFTIMTVLYLPISLVATVFGTDLFDSGDPTDNIDRFKTSAVATSVATHALSLLLVWLADRLDLPQTMLRRVKAWHRDLSTKLNRRQRDEAPESESPPSSRVKVPLGNMVSGLRRRNHDSAAWRTRAAMALAPIRPAPRSVLSNSRHLPEDASWAQNFRYGESQRLSRLQANTNRLIYWVVKTSNAIIRTANPKTLGRDAQREPNNSGSVTVAGLVSLTKLISQHVSNVPVAILKLFQSVIDARTASHRLFQQLAQLSPDADVLRSNASHKAFIDALVAAFEVLGGHDAIRAGREANHTATPVDEKDDLDKLLLINKFAALHVEKSKDATRDVGESEDDAGAALSPTRRKQARPGKRKKSKSSKKAQRPVTADRATIEDLPLESFRFLLDDEGTHAEYCQAALELFREMGFLRGTMQSV
ncbi:hypothetical protein OQA88_13450 [Cercophora sp. LCS_1]